MKRATPSALFYFSQFSYPATLDQLQTFHPKKISKPILQRKLNTLISDKIVRTIKINSVPRYVLTGTKGAQNYTIRYNHSLNLTHQSEQYLRVLELIPFIQYLGISGSLSVLNATQRSDIDIFIITAPGTLWVTRFIVVVYKKILSLFHPLLGYKLCFNLFFSQNGLLMTQKKQTEYIGHEILQLKPIFNKSQTYEILLQKNQWIGDFFPNVHINSGRSNSQFRLSKQSYLISIIESFTRSIQTWWLDRKGYEYSERGNQLWLIQKDYEKELL